MHPSKANMWLKRILIPLWSLQLIFTIATIVTYIIVAAVDTPYHFRHSNKSVFSFLYISTIILIILDIFVCIMVFFQMFMFYKHNLSAKTMLITQIILSMYWATCLIIELLGISDALNGGMKSLLDFCFTIVATLAFWAALIYSTVVLCRQRRLMREALPAYDSHAPPEYASEYDLSTIQTLKRTHRNEIEQA